MNLRFLRAGLLVLIASTSFQSAAAVRVSAHAVDVDGVRGSVGSKSDSPLQGGLDRVAGTSSARLLAGVDAYRLAYPRLRFAPGKMGTSVLVDVVARIAPHSLASRLERLGAEHVALEGRMISARIPVNALQALATDSDLAFVRPVMARAWRGRVTSQGDFALRAPLVRPPLSSGGPTGAGVTVGVMSDSFDCRDGASQDIANGEYSPVEVLRDEPDCSSGSDEGRAMVQIVADVAPDASLVYRTAFDGQADFAQGIRELADHGADVVVDDIGYYTSPYYHDGIIAQAVDEVFGRGVAYFSAAANLGRKSYESTFRPIAVEPMDASGKGFAHDFAPGSRVEIYQGIRVAAGETISIGLQWDDAFLSSSTDSAGAKGDLDLYLLDPQLTQVVAQSAEFNVGNDAVEVMSFTNSGATATYYLRIEYFGGRQPSRIKYIDFGDGDDLVVDYSSSSSTIVGQPNARGAFAVGAAAYDRTPECGVTSAELEYFSSAGGTAILLGSDGKRQSTETRHKPDAVGPDGANTTFFGHDIANPGGISECRDRDSRPNFFGTSAAAPHVAGVAALMLEKTPYVTPSQVYGALRDSTVDMGAAGFDFDTGMGFVRADHAVVEIASALPTVTFSRTRQTVDEGSMARVALILNTASAVPITVNLTLSGSATPGLDYSAPPLAITIPAGKLSKGITIPTIDDDAVESSEAVVVTLDQASGADVGQQHSFRVTIHSDE